jgi:DNA-binding NarL/FixJ family response regulator
MGTKVHSRGRCIPVPRALAWRQIFASLHEKALMTALLLNSCNITVNPIADNDHREHEVNVLIADDHRSRSYHIWASLSSLRAVPRISTGESREEVLRLAARHAPEVSLVSATFGGGEGFTVANRLKHCTAPAPVLIYADAVDPRLAGAAIVAGADGTFAWEADANRLGELIGRVLHGEKLFPPLLPDPFEELASHVAEEDRRIVAMLLSGGDPDAIARSCGISARGFTSRRQAIVRRLDAAYARGPVSPPRAQPSHQVCDDTLQHASPPVIFG